MGCLLAVGYGALTYQFASAGHIPLFSRNIDLARVALPGGPTAVLPSALGVVVIATLTRRQRLLSREAFPEFLVAAVALLGATLQGGRLPIILPLAIVLVARSIVWGLPRRELIIAGVLFVAALFTTAYYYRASQHPWTPFESELLHEVLPSIPWFLRPLVPLHIALVTNLDALSHITTQFPIVQPFGHGIYSSAAFDSVLPAARHVSAVSATISPNFITSTFAGPLWADGGLPLVLIGAGLFGFMSTLAYAYARRTRRVSFVFLSAYLYVVALMGIYLNLFTDTADWLLLIPLLFGVGLFGEVKPAAGGRASKPQRPQRRLTRAVLVTAGLIAGADLVAASALGMILRGPQGVFKAEVSVPITLAAAHVFSDGDVFGKKLVLWSAHPARRSLDISRLSFDFPDFWERRTHAFTVEPIERVRSVGGPVVVDVASFRIGESEALFTAAQTGARLRIRVFDLRALQRPAEYLVPVGAPPAHVARQIEVSRWSGAIADLFVIDLSAPPTRIRVRVFSGESGFQAKLVDVRTRPLASSWTYLSVDVGRLGGPKPDLLVVDRRGQSGRLELHLASGESRYQHFVLDVPTEIRARDAGRYRVLLAARDGLPAVAAIDMRKKPATVSFLDLPNLADVALAQKRRDLNR